MKQITLALYFLLFLATAAPAHDDHPPVQADGRTWVWNNGLNMYAPQGANWQYDADRETWWRDRPKTTSTSSCGTVVDFTWVGGKWVPTDPSWTWDAAGGYWTRPMRMNMIGATDPNPPGQVFYGAYTPGGMAACVGGR